MLRALRAAQALVRPVQSIHSKPNKPDATRSALRILLIAPTRNRRFYRKSKILRYRANDEANLFPTENPQLILKMTKVVRGSKVTRLEDIKHHFV